TGFEEAGVLRFAAALEKGSEHPLADAVLRAAKEREIDVPKTENFEAVTGKGVKGTVEKQPVALGNAKLMDDLGVDITALQSAADELRKEGGTAMFIAVDGKAAGIIAVADPIKETT